MKAFRYLGARKAELVEIPQPTIHEGEALARVLGCGICATDVKTFLRGHPLIPPGTVLGHELVGEIVESRAEGVQPGMRVMIAPYLGCGQCALCRRGRYSLCERLFEAATEPGGFCEFVRIPPRIVAGGLHALPPTLDTNTATLAEPLACCYHGLDVVGLRPGESVLIIGDGPMGLLQTVAAREMGASRIIVAGKTPERLAWAAARADAVIDVARLDLRETALALNAGRGYERVMLSVAAPDLVEVGLALTARGGGLNVFAGLPRDARLSVDPFKIHYDEVSLVGTFGFGGPDFARAARALSAGALDLRGFITKTVGLDGIEAAFAESAAYQGIKTVVNLA
ncbi:MAG: alcohol dehydrogenase catalytic domain-containing protein [Thermoflexales bacterium]|nr:alcohol dehydrogenase catalytic domain-containing protein [Thermoflexales bacterium]